MRWLRFNKYLYKYWKLQAAVICLSLLATPLGLVNPYLTKLVIDRAYGNKDLNLFFILAVIGGTAFLFSGLVTSLSQYLSKALSKNVAFDMTRDFLRHIQGLPLAFHNERSTGENIYRIGNDVKTVSDFVCDAIPQIIKLVPYAVFILAIICRLNWRMAVLASFLIPIIYLQPYLFSKLQKKITLSNIEKAQAVSVILHEILSHIRLVKTMAKEKYEMHRYEEGLKGDMNLELKNVKFMQICNLSSSILGRLITGIITLYGGYMVIRGMMTLGSLTAVIIYFGQFVTQLGMLGSLYQRFTINSVARDRLIEIMEIKPDICDAEGTRPYRIKEGRIEFKDISFRYKKDSPVLKTVTFSIPPAARAALVGLSGSGKSSILSLILRLYRKERGDIFIDGIDIEKMTIESLRSQIGIALQEPLLWNDTIANNILYGACQSASRSDIIEAAKLAKAHNFIMALPEGYDSVIGENGCKISGGEMQRIAIARALIKRPKILILDEAMSSLDRETEEMIIDNIFREYDDSTIIIVSHRLSAVQKTDKVYFLKDGVIAQEGSHRELFEKDAEYGGLFAKVQNGLDSSVSV